MTDNLPELPEPHHAYQNGVGMDNWAGDYFTADQMRSYALTAIATERARADTLQEKFNCADLMAQCMAGLREDCIEAGVVDESVPPMMYPEEIIPRLVRADALEAALREVLLAQENYARCHAREVNAINNYSGGQAEYSSATLKATVRVSEAERAARALLEKKT